IYITTQKTWSMSEPGFYSQLRETLAGNVAPPDTTAFLDDRERELAAFIDSCNPVIPAEYAQLKETDDAEVDARNALNILGFIRQSQQRGIDATVRIFEFGRLFERFQVRLSEH